MIDLRELRKDPDAFRKSLRQKRYDPATYDRLVELDREWRELNAAVEELRSRRNQANQAIKSATPEERPAAIEEAKAFKEDLQGKEKRLAEVEAELDEVKLQIPNPPHETAAEGAGEEENRVEREVGEPRQMGFEPKDHLELSLDRGWIDMERGAKVAGSRFAYLHGPLVHLQLGLQCFALQLVESKGFLSTVTPVLVNERAMYGTGFFPADRFEIYEVLDGEKDSKYLVGTSEVTLAGLHMDEVVPEESFPRRYAGFSTCLRREAGAAGKDTRGIFRVHQFDKVEMFSYTLPEKSWEEHEYLLSIEEEIMQALEIPYRIVNVCDGDLGAPAAKKFDLEGWFPGQQRYRELTSCSNCTDFQARRLKVRAKSEGEKPRLAHTLNGTAIAIGRTLIALLENHQQEDGSVRVPEALRPYVPGGVEAIGLPRE